ncbi:MAG: Epoxyqueuosine reductase [Luteibacter sp.]|uniref:tRNA epoxyqueuosine(34) reductase QueG n=1 Tax=Luteibacter sp. TaxID=1886636 RepID=UPI00137CCA46|nr:tRNA epoxyqueuosine(34) reductase QueG [Luteibacter sp.]KAF1009671.1 MAG: Epoxyqueuosine reductase [Luteibacter sp.]
MHDPSAIDYAALALDIKRWARELGFADVGIAGTDLGHDEAYLERWLADGHHGDMEYMARHGTRRSRPAELEPGTLRVVSVRMDYIPPGTANAWDVIHDGEKAYVARYALGRDYHKVMRNRLQKLAARITERVGDFSYRAYVDSAPVLEKAIARNAGLGWIGKHTVLINKRAGSYFFLGKLYTDLPLPADEAASAHCGSCRRCIDICPTQAIVAPYRLDARKCISYLTIELRGSIPEELRAPMGNRVFGCDDCQLICPWNKFAQEATEPDFAPRHSLDGAKLIELFGWSEETFLSRTEGMAIRRTGYEGWLRNLAVGLGNAPTTADILDALRQRSTHPSAIVREHVAWALNRHGTR